MSDEWKNLTSAPIDLPGPTGPEDEPVDFVTEFKPDGSFLRKRLDRLSDGRVMCCLCFEFVTRDRLNPLNGDPDGAVQDVCRPCAVNEAHYLAWRQTFAGRKTFKVLITGSRDWPRNTVIHDVLDLLLTASITTNRRLVLTEGECPTGADDDGKDWAVGHGALLDGPKRVSLDPWAADWDICAPDCPQGHRRPKKGGLDLHPGRRNDYCPTAGHRRNQDMVDSRPDVCLAFIKDGSSGATHCAGAAGEAGIVTVTWRIEGGLLLEPPGGWAHQVPV